MCFILFLLKVTLACIRLHQDDYNYINNKLVNDKGYLETLEDYKDSRIFGIGYDNGYTGVKENKELTNMVINEYKNNDWLNRDRKNLNYVIEEKSLIIKDDNSIWSKIKNFFKRILKK